MAGALAGAQVIYLINSKYEQNHPEAVVRLLELGALSLVDDNGDTPLGLARSLGSAEAIKALQTHI